METFSCYAKHMKVSLVSSDASYAETNSCTIVRDFFRNLVKSRRDGWFAIIGPQGPYNTWASETEIQFIEQQSGTICATATLVAYRPGRHASSNTDVDGHFTLRDVHVTGATHYASATATPVSPEAASVFYARTHGDSVMAAHQAAVAELARRAEGDELAMQALRLSAAMLHLTIGMVGGHQEAREAASSILGKLQPTDDRAKESVDGIVQRRASLMTELAK